MNEILRRALLSAHLDETDVAARLEVDPKTVRRWLEGRLPFTRHRWALADLLNVSEADLWPDLRPKPPRPDELLAVYPHRSSITRETWRNLFVSAKHEIGILDDSSLFLAEDTEIVHTFAKKARDGIRVRIALAEPENPHYTALGRPEDVSAATTPRIHRALALFRPLCDIPGVEVRLHRVVLYNSIYRVDNELLCNQHAYGVTRSQGAVLHLRHRANTDFASTYISSFEKIWDAANLWPAYES